jgi:hypothetical protein
MYHLQMAKTARNCCLTESFIVYWVVHKQPVVCTGVLKELLRSSNNNTAYLWFCWVNVKHPIMIVKV